MPSRLPLLILVLGAVAMAGCASQPVVPKTVLVPVGHYVAPPDEVTAACPVAQPHNREVGEVVRVAHARGLALTYCANPRLKIVRAFGQCAERAGTDVAALKACVSAATAAVHAATKTLNNNLPVRADTP